SLRRRLPGVLRRSGRIAGLRPGTVAQICNLLYRRFSICRAPKNSVATVFSDALPSATRRYSRLQICATVAAAFLLAIANPVYGSAGDSAIRFGGVPMELTVSEVSERTVRLQLSPLDEQGHPRSGAPSTVLAPFAAKARLRVRELAKERELRAGKLHLTLRPQPLTITVRRADGKPVQELAFDDRNGTNAVIFTMNAPVLGLGEGEEQFDRRGHYYRM